MSDPTPPTAPLPLSRGGDERGITFLLAELKEKNPHAYPRDYARELGISEADLTPTYYPDRVHELGNVESVFAILAKLPRIKFMARTSFAVFELFTRVDFQREGGALILKSSLCFVALAAAKLGKVFFLSPATEKDKAAVLIFDASGAAALKLYIEASEFDHALLTSTTAMAENQPADLGAIAGKIKATLIRGLSPVVYEPETTAARKLIEDAATAKAAVAFELLTDTIAVVMVHKPVKIIDARGWFNILDEDFNLHLKEEAITRLAGEEYAATKSVRAENTLGEWVKFYGPLAEDCTLTPRPLSINGEGEKEAISS